MRRAQAAMEFLMTYGWALLVVIIVIAALAFFGLLNPTRFLPEKCDFGPGISCTDFNALAPGGTAGNFINVLVSNGLGTPMTIHSINVTNCVSSIGSIGTNGTYPYGASYVIVEGTTQNFTLGNCSNLLKGSRFKSDLVISYNITVLGNVISHTKKGFISVNVQ